MGHYHRVVKCHIRVSQFFGNFVEGKAEAFDEAMPSFDFSEGENLGLPVDYFRIAVFDKVGSCWCYFCQKVSVCGRSGIGRGVRVVLVCFCSCKRVDLWRRCGRCVGVILRGGGKIAGLTDEARVMFSFGCQTAGSYNKVAALVAPYTSNPQKPVAFTTMRLIWQGCQSFTKLMVGTSHCR